MTFRYDFFLSYSRSDLAWADRLRHDLVLRGVPADRIFMDVTSVEPGVVWPDELRSAVRSSRHLLVLWTEAAKAAEWVSYEQATFVAAEEATKDRRMILLRLQGESKVWSNLQMIDLTGADLLATAPPAMTAQQREKWSRAVGDIKGVYEEADDRIPIGTTIVAMTRAEADALRGDETMGDRTEPLLEVLQRLEISDLDALRERYVADRTRWQPFGGERPIDELLDEAFGQLNSSLDPGQPKFRWSFSDFLHPELAKAKQCLSALRSEVALVVIDPLSLFCTRVLSRFTLLDPFFRRDQTLILVLSPFSLPQSYAHLRDLVKRAATPLLDFHYEPSAAGPSEPRAHIGADVCDTEEVTRLVKSQVVRRRSELFERPGSAFTRIGGTPR